MTFNFAFTNGARNYNDIKTKLDPNYRKLRQVLSFQDEI